MLTDNSYSICTVHRVQVERCSVYSAYSADTRYVILRKGLVEIGELSPQEVAAGDVMLIPSMCPQRITNTGKDDLIFLAICSPRFVQDAYEDIEDIIPVFNQR